MKFFENLKKLFTTDIATEIYVNDSIYDVKNEVNANVAEVNISLNSSIKYVENKFSSNISDIKNNINESTICIYRDISSKVNNINDVIDRLSERTDSNFLNIKSDVILRTDTISARFDSKIDKLQSFIDDKFVKRKGDSCVDGSITVNALRTGSNIEIY